MPSTLTSTAWLPAIRRMVARVAPTAASVAWKGLACATERAVEIRVATRAMRVSTPSATSPTTRS